MKWGEAGEILKVLGVGLPLVIGGFWLFNRLESSQRQQLSPSEYDACVQAETKEFIQQCYRERLAEDMAKSRAELPRLPSQEERLKVCRADLLIARSAAKLYPARCGDDPRSAK